MAGNLANGGSGCSKVMGFASAQPILRPAVRRVTSPKALAPYDRCRRILFKTQHATASTEALVMKRFLIFAVVGPPLGFVMAFWVMLQVANWALGSPSTFDLHQVVLLPAAYLVGMIPALLTAWFDHVLARIDVPYRIGLTAAFAYAISYVPLVAALTMGFVHGPFVLLLGLVGAVPAALCSWLATDRRGHSIGA